MRKTVSPVTGTPFSLSAQPKPAVQTASSPSTRVMVSPTAPAWAISLPITSVMAAMVRE